MIKLFLITEGSFDIGFGHITRCTSLYQAFEEKGIIPKLIINGDETVNGLLSGKKYSLLGWLKNRKDLYHLIKGSDIVVIDSYLAAPDFYNDISNIAKLSVYIDDNKRIDYPKGIVVNGTIFAEKMDYPPKKDIDYLLGSMYIPLRKEFWYIQAKGIKEDIESVMVTFGGDDSRNMTSKVLRLLVDRYPKLTKKVIIGKGFRNTNEIESIKDNRTGLIYYPNAEGMKKVMLESDIAISAGGQTLYEFARVGIPTIAITVADNQLNNIKGWQKTGFIEYAGWWENKVLDNIVKAIELLKCTDLRRKRAEIGKRIIDGLGARRIAGYCIKKYLTENLILRRAEIRDMYNIYELSNEPETRENSFNQKRIELEEHKRWFLNKLDDKDCLFLVGEAEGEFLGQIRFDINGSEAIINISVNNKYRGLGIGKMLTEKAIDFLRLNNQSILYIKSYIKKGNSSSIKLFEKANFKFMQEIIIKGQKAFEYQYHVRRG